MSEGRSEWLVSSETHAPNVVFEAQAATFLAPEAHLSLAEQLSFMREFWSKLGFIVPVLTGNELQTVTDVRDRLPFPNRVVPTPLLKTRQLIELGERARSVFLKNQFGEGPAVRTPDYSRGFMQLIAEVEEDRVDPRAPRILMQVAPVSAHSPKIEVVPKEEFAKRMLEVGQAKLDDLGNIWLFPVVDVVTDEPENVEASHLVSKINPTLTKESVITLILIEQAAGIRTKRKSIDLVNELVYDRNRGEMTPPQAVGCVQWGSHQIQFMDRRVESRDIYEVRSTRSGLMRTTP